MSNEYTNTCHVLLLLNIDVHWNIFLAFMVLFLSCVLCCGAPFFFCLEELQGIFSLYLDDRRDSVSMGRAVYFIGHLNYLGMEGRDDELGWVLVIVHLLLEHVRHG